MTGRAHIACPSMCWWGDICPFSSSINQPISIELLAPINVLYMTSFEINLSLEYVKHHQSFNIATLFCIMHVLTSNHLYFKWKYYWHREYLPFHTHKCKNLNINIAISDFLSSGVCPLSLKARELYIHIRFAQTCVIERTRPFYSRCGGCLPQTCT